MAAQNGTPLITVIIPVYNGAEYVGETIESALRQTYRNLEVIVVDDGSTDATLSVLQSYAHQDERVRVISQPNSGVSKARNTAIAAARGEFIAPLDADDLWLPTKLDRQLRRMLEAGEDTGIVYTWWAWIDERGIIVDRSPRWTIEGDVLDKLMYINFIGNASVPLFRKHCLVEAGGYNPELAAAKSGGCEDLEVALRIASRYSIAVVPDILVGYRRVPGSMSTACDTMWRSRQMILRNILPLRPDITTALLRRSDRQFSIYLAALSFWSGNVRQAIRWGLRSGVKLPFLFAPHILKALLRPKPTQQTAQIMRPGETIDAASIPEPLLPYDLIFPAR